VQLGVACLDATDGGVSVVQAGEHLIQGMQGAQFVDVKERRLGAHRLLLALLRAVATASLLRLVNEALDVG
jgi:hypothetical protein